MVAQIKQVTDLDVLDDSHLSRTLIQLNIMPFESTSLAAYKQRMVLENPPSFWYRHRVNIMQIPGALVGICLIFGLIFTIFGLFAITAGHFLSGLPGADHAYSLAAENLPYAFLMFITTFPMMYVEMKLSNIKVRGKAVWRERALDTFLFDNHIPHDAELKVRAIKKQYPMAQFYVEELVQEDDILDPFLFVVDPQGGEKWYIHQWDEPLFKAA